jgi:hypothetical protein
MSNNVVGWVLFRNGIPYRLYDDPEAAEEDRGWLDTVAAVTRARLEELLLEGDDGDE